MLQAGRRGLVTVVATAMAAVALTAVSPPGARSATTDPDPGALETANAALARRAAAEGMVLLENHDAALPLAAGTNIALFGVGAYGTVKGGTGSGNVHNRYTVTVRAGLEEAGHDITTSATYWDAITAAYDAALDADKGGDLGASIDYASIEQPLTASSVRPTAATDTAIYVLSRNSGEGHDRSAGAGDYGLGAVERADLRLIGRTYRHVVVVLNTGGVVDTSFFSSINAAVADPDGDRALDALLLMSQAGQESGRALADVVDGTVSPSGRLTDTWASAYSYYPTAATFAGHDGDSKTEAYTESVYVGYRYFDSFYKSLAADPDTVVNYPFGYGLSYADFRIDPESVEATMDRIAVRARVTNVGDGYSGRKVVETYFSAPQTGLDKPYQELAGYAKTDLLAPGESQTVTISFDTTELASYDERTAAWTMDAGDYLIRVGSSSRNTQVAATVHLAADTITEQDSHQLTDQVPASVLTSDPADFYTYPTEAAEIAAAPTLTLDTSGFTAPDRSSRYEQSVPVDSSSRYYEVDGDTISTITAYLPEGQTDWEGTGAPYPVKTGETVERVATSPDTTLYDVAAGRVTMAQFVAGLSVTQLANLVEGSTANRSSTQQAAGVAGFTTAKYESLGVPGMALADGPAGLRITQQSTTTPTAYQFATAWPIGTLLAQTWDRDLLQQVGEAVGKEMAEYGVQLWLAPGMNIHRDPLNGRNFEYYSEDPLVSGLTAASTTDGVQSIPGVGVTIKHFAANNQETDRDGGNVIASERGLREIELRSFELAVKNAEPMAVMSSYNRIGGSYAAQNYDLLTDLLRGEWDYDGLVMSDWRGSHDALATMYAGNDLIEPGNLPENIINATFRSPPTIDVAGLPVYRKNVTSSSTTYTWTFNGLTPSASGTDTVSTTIDSTTDLSRTPASGTATVDAANNEVFTPDAGFASVDAAYDYVQSLLAGTALSATRKAAITVAGVEHQDPADPDSAVTAYTVTIRGNYTSSGYDMRLGDLQRSAMRVLTTAMQSSAFAELADLQDVAGVEVGPYTAQFDDLEDTVAATREPVVPQQAGQTPTVSLSAAPRAPARGWYTGTVTVSVSSDPADARRYLDLDAGELRPYAGPVTVTGDGVHRVRAVAAAGGRYSELDTTTIRIDSVRPKVVATTSAKGRLVLSATDARSGVRRVQYALRSGSWRRYTGPVVLPPGRSTVRYRAVDLAGNVSTTGSTTVHVASLTLRTPTISGTPRVGKRLVVKAQASAGARLTYRWLRDGRPIPGATASSYRVVSADRGHRIGVRVTASSGGRHLSRVATAGRVG